MKAILKNLKDQTLKDDEAIMYCSICGSEYSANLGDYWDVNDSNFEFKCCEETMDIVVKKTIYEEVKENV